MFNRPKQRRPATRSEVIDILDRKPPRSFAQIRKTLRQTVKIIRSEINRIEKEFIGNKKDLSDELRSWVVPLKAVIRGSREPELSSARVIDGIFTKSATPGVKLPIDPMDLVRLKECMSKVREYVPFRFNRVVDLTQKSLKILQKYCLSFYDMVNDPPLGTAYDFHTSAISIADKVKVLLEKSRMMAFKFQAEYLSLRSDFFSSNTRQIAARCECETMPFLVMFPQVCENMREVAALLDRWIQADENYAEYIRHDIDDIEKERQKLVHKTRELQENCYHLQYRLKLSQQEDLQNYQELQEWKRKSNELTVEEEMIHRELNDKRIDLEIKEFKRAELIRSKDELDPSVFQEQLDMQTLEIKKYKDEVKMLTKKLDSVKHRLNRCEERQDLLVARENTTAGIQTQLDTAELARYEAETEMSAVVEKLELAKRIHLHKTCLEMLERIHFAQPLEAKSPRQTQSDEMLTFDTVCTVVCDYIGGDWCRLYRNLPFVPARGNLNLEADIENIVQSNTRDSAPHHALRALHRWRRFYTRAKAEDLIQTLKRIKRTDIVDEIDYVLNPPVLNEKVEETPPPSFLAQYLVPCYKEVERYDQLRAANRIPPLGWEATRLIL